jgi:hypothetical protein
MKECPYAKTYQGIHPPKCNGGNPCEKCKEIYREAQRQRAIHRYALREQAQQLGFE